MLSGRQATLSGGIYIKSLKTLKIDFCYNNRSIPPDNVACLPESIIGQ
jgi:hypothetical protein